MSDERAISDILHGLEAGTVIPYIGAGIWATADPPPAHPADPLDLVAKLTAQDPQQPDCRRAIY
jgi:hypothetical protein